MIALIIYSNDSLRFPVFTQDVLKSDKARLIIDNKRLSSLCKGRRTDSHDHHCKE